MIPIHLEFSFRLVEKKWFLPTVSYRQGPGTQKKLSTIVPGKLGYQKNYLKRYPLISQQNLLMNCSDVNEVL